MAENKYSGEPAPHFVTIDPLDQPRRVMWLDKEDQPYAAPFQYSCQALGICQNRYPDCGRCDDYHPEDESETLTPMDHIYAWCISGAIVLAAFIGVCVLALSAGWIVHLVAKLWPL